MTQNLAFYCKKFAKLRVDRARGIAPHKPILLLAVAELIERGEITQNRIYPSPGLIAKFFDLMSPPTLLQGFPLVPSLLGSAK